MKQTVFVRGWKSAICTKQISRELWRITTIYFEEGEKVLYNMSDGNIFVVPAEDVENDRIDGDNVYRISMPSFVEHFEAEGIEL